MFNIESEVSSAVEDGLLENLLFYGSEFPEYRDEIFKEFEKQSIQLIRQVKKELDTDEEE